MTNWKHISEAAAEQAAELLRHRRAFAWIEQERPGIYDLEDGVIWIRWGWVNEADPVAPLKLSARHPAGSRRGSHEDHAAARGERAGMSTHEIGPGSSPPNLREGDTIRYTPGRYTDPALFPGAAGAIGHVVYRGELDSSGNAPLLDGGFEHTPLMLRGVGVIAKDFDACNAKESVVTAGRGETDGAELLRIVAWNDPSPLRRSGNHMIYSLGHSQNVTLRDSAGFGSARSIIHARSARRLSISGCWARADGAPDIEADSTASKDRSVYTPAYWNIGVALTNCYASASRSPDPNVIPPGYSSEVRLMKFDDSEDDEQANTYVSIEGFFGYVLDRYKFAPRDIIGWMATRPRQTGTYAQNVHLRVPRTGRVVNLNGNRDNTLDNMTYTKPDRASDHKVDWRQARSSIYAIPEGERVCVDAPGIDPQLSERVYRATSRSAWPEARPNEEIASVFG